MAANVFRFGFTQTAQTATAFLSYLRGLTAGFFRSMRTQ